MSRERVVRNFQSVAVNALDIKFGQGIFFDDYDLRLVGHGSSDTLYLTVVVQERVLGGVDIVAFCENIVRLHITRGSWHAIYPCHDQRCMTL